MTKGRNSPNIKRQKGFWDMEVPRKMHDAFNCVDCPSANPAPRKPGKLSGGVGVGGEMLEPLLLLLLLLLARFLLRHHILSHTAPPPPLPLPPLLQFKGPLPRPTPPQLHLRRRLLRLRRHEAREFNWQASLSLQPLGPSRGRKDRNDDPSLARPTPWIRRRGPLRFFFPSDVLFLSFLRGRLVT